MTAPKRLSLEELERIHDLMREDINPDAFLASVISSLWHGYDRALASKLDAQTRTIIRRAITASQLLSHIAALEAEIAEAQGENIRLRAADVIQRKPSAADIANAERVADNLMASWRKRAEEADARVAEEREACAKVAESYNIEGVRNTGSVIAAAIRARVR